MLCPHANLPPACPPGTGGAESFAVHAVFPAAQYVWRNGDMREAAVAIEKGRCGVAFQRGGVTAYPSCPASDLEHAIRRARKAGGWSVRGDHGEEQPRNP